VHLNYNVAPWTINCFSGFSIIFLIYFRAENKIKHCRIILDGSSFSIGSATFESLPELVAYYQKHPLFRKMKLRYAVNQALVDKCGEVVYNLSQLSCGSL